MKIKTQIFLTGLISSIVPLILVSCMLISVYNRELDRIIVNDLRSITTAQIAIIDNFFYERNVSMSVLSDYDILHGLLSRSNAGEDISNTEEQAMINHIFTTQKQRQSFLYSVTAFDKQHRIVACTEPIDTAITPAFSSIESLDTLGRSVRFSRIIEQGEFGTRKRCLTAIRAVYTKTDDLIGYIVEEISLEFFEDLRISTDLVNDGYIYITDGAGGLISAGSGTEQRTDFVLEPAKRNSFNEAWAVRDSSQNVGIMRYKVDNQNHITAYGGFQNADWQILTSVNIDNILQTHETFFHVLLIALLATVLLMIAVDMITNRTLTRPIEQMLKTFEDIRSSKDYSKRIKGIHRNEIGVIVNEVNDLLEDIERTILHQEQNLRILKERAERDSLTLLFNKREIKEVLSLKLENACVNKRLLACVLVDIDDFKSFNTRFGHLGGDEAIIFVASLMRDISGDTAGRIGGDEFVMCLDSFESREEIAHCLENFISRLHTGLDIEKNGTLIPIRCSIGATLLHGRALPACDTLIQAADQAMYKIKNSTKDGFYIV